MDPLTRLLLDMTYLLLIAGGCSIIFSRLKMPPIVGYLAAGIILGPTMLHDISVDPATITLLSSLGIVLLMFSIGLELNLQRLRKLGTFIFIVLALEMPFMVVVGYLVGLAIGLGSVESIFLGAVLSGTSTAVIVSVLHSRKDINKDDAETIISITVLEDLGQVIILTMAAPLLVGNAPALGSTVLMIGGIALFIGVSIVLGILVIPRMLNWVGRKHSGEVLFIISIGLCFAMALVSNLIGLSIAIGAFLMGLIVSQANCAKEVLVKVGPMKEVFMAVFFISIGIQIVPTEILSNIVLVLIIAAVFISAKFIGVAGASYLVGGRARSSFMVAIGLVAMGEFAFIIAKTALDAGVVNQQFYTSVIGAALVTMFVLPVVSKNSTKIFDRFSRAIPGPVQETIQGYDGLRAEIGRRASMSPKARRSVNRELALIFVDVLAIVLIQTMFIAFDLFSGLIEPLAVRSNINPNLLLVLLNAVLMLPAMINMVQGIKRIAKVLADSGAAEKYVTNDRRLYRRFRNLGELAAVLIMVLLLLPFIAQYLGVYVSIWIAAMSLGVALVYTSWRVYRHARHHLISVSRSKDKEI